MPRLPAITLGCYICRIRQSKKRDELFFLCFAAASKFTSPFLPSFYSFSPSTFDTEEKKTRSLARSTSTLALLSVPLMPCIGVVKAQWVQKQTNVEHGRMQKVS